MEGRIALIAPDHRLAEDARQVVTKMDSGVEVYLGSLGEGLQIAQQCVENGIEMIISRGGTGDLLRKNLSIPVISLKTTSYDIIHSISDATKISSNVGIIGFQDMVQHYEKVIRLMEEVFSANIISHTIVDNFKLGHELIELYESGTEVFIGGQFVNKLARQLSLSSVLIGTSPETIEETILRAQELLKIQLEERRSTELLRSIINFAYDGILAINEKGSITVFNPVIQKLTGITEQDALGQPVDDVVENSRMRHVLNTGVPELGEIQHIGSASIVTNRVPIHVNDQIMGVVATFQEIDKFQNIERSVRKKLLSKGYVARSGFDDIIGNSNKLNLAKQKARQYAATDSTVLILGESGTGKELFAQSIHNASRRRNKPFVAINCASLPETLLESELFGYVDGAFTGAKKGGKAGLFELAHCGTIFLDEIGEMLPQLQARLLRVLQEKEVMRLGDDCIVPVDIRIIAASNSNLLTHVAKGDFREDLFYRICVLKLDVPPLREREGDIALLIDCILKRKCRQMNKPPITIASDVLSRLMLFEWPGNVRQLENIIERCVAICQTDIIDMALAVDCLTGLWVFSNEDQLQSANGSVLRHLEDDMIRKVLAETNGNRKQAAERLGISKTTLWRRTKDMQKESEN